MKILFLKNLIPYECIIHFQMNCFDFSHKTSSKGCPCKYIKSSSSIWTAAEQNDKYAVELQLLKSPNINKCDVYGYTALHYAAQHGNLEIVVMLLNKGMEVNLNNCGATPLHRAAYAGHYQCCKALLMANADINSLDTSFGDNMTAYQKAYNRGHTDIVELLKEWGCSTTSSCTTTSSSSDSSSNITSSSDSGSSSINSSSIITCLDEKVVSVQSVNTSVNTNLTTSSSSFGGQCSRCNNISLTFKRVANGDLVCTACSNARNRLHISL